MTINQVKTWVLLRGLTREHRHWEDFPEKLQQCFPGSRIITPDLPGNGDHADITSSTSIQDMMLFLRKDIASTLASGPVHIIGLSMGAMVAIEWMKSYPQECAASILINTSLKGISPFYQRLRPKNYYRILYSLFTSDNSRREKTVLQMTSNLYPDTEQLLQRWVSYAEENTVLPSNALRQLLAASRYSAPKLKPGVPILLLSSENDNLVNSKSSLSLAQKWLLPIETHPLAGHDIPLDDGDWVCQKIDHWLSNDPVSSI
ncbi:MAG: alpha/beta hydrolase [Proteobacteria bacterium]|nr:alpha/beta hydrolase [Pseudomonadota bacterium]